MALEAKRFRHLAGAVSIVATADFLTAGPSQQRAQAQRPDPAYHQTLIGWRCC
jgi:hypothetical protein